MRIAYLQWRLCIFMPSCFLPSSLSVSLGAAQEQTPEHSKKHCQKDPLFGFVFLQHGPLIDLFAVDVASSAVETMHDGHCGSNGDGDI